MFRYRPHDMLFPRIADITGGLEPNCNTAPLKKPFNYKTQPFLDDSLKYSKYNTVSTIQ
jgi:hypothetical protein